MTSEDMSKKIDEILSKVRNSQQTDSGHGVFLRLLNNLIELEFGKGSLYTVAVSGTNQKMIGLKMLTNIKSKDPKVIAETLSKHAEKQLDKYIEQWFRRKTEEE